MRYLKNIFLGFVFLLMLAPFARAGEPASSDTEKKFKMFVVETDPDSASESLDRISGHVDLGFATPDQTYDANHPHYSGPFTNYGDDR